MTQEVHDAVETILFGDKTAHWYQIAVLHQVEEAIERGAKRILVVLPTGAGKTITSGLIFSSDRIRRALGVFDRPLDLLFIAHVNRLLTQAERTYAEAANINFQPQSAFSRIKDNTNWDIACIDEAHHEAMDSIQYQLEKLGDKIIIGLTATPDRADGCIIKFDTIVNPISREQAVTEGYLARTKLNSVVDGSERNKADVICDMLDRYHSELSKSLVFVRTKKEVAKVAEKLNNLGIPTIGLVDQSNDELNQALDDFSAGTIRAVVSCNRLGEGIDVKGAEHIIIGRQVDSYPLLNQMIGRGARPDSECIIWEFINPLSGTNLDTTCVVGTPDKHRLIYRKRGAWQEQEFDYAEAA